MKSVFKWFGIVLGVLLGIIIIFAAVVYFSTESNLYKKYPVAAVPITVPLGDPAVIARGEHLTQHIAVCVDCHGEDFGGGIVIDDPAIGRVVAPNLTTGQEGFGSVLSDEDIARILRTGVLPDGKSLWVMPVEDYVNMSQSDLESVIAYIRSLPPVDSNLGKTTLGPLGRLLYFGGQLPINTADNVDQDPAIPPAPEMGVTLEYGHYLSNTAGCTGCHGPGLSGGPIPGAPPDWPPAANISPSGAVQSWTEEQFINTIRTGVDPNGHEINPVMPWRRYAGMTDDELKAIWIFVQSVPPKEYGNR
jgi:mono/diheme cytochrome c family protein